VPVEAAKLRAIVAGGEAKVVCWLCEGAQGGGGPREQKVREMSAEEAKLRAAIRWEEAVVR
jgi:hypothetical protein